MNLGVQISPHALLSILMAYPQKRNCWSSDNSICNFCRNWHTVFHMVCTVLYLSQQCTNVPVSPHPYQLWPFSVSNGFEWYHTRVLICISLVINDAEHVFLCLLDICISSLEKCLFKSFPYFELVFCCCWLSGVLCRFCILITHQINDLQMFSPILGFPFYSVFLMDKILNFNEVLFVFFSFIACFLMSYPKIIVRSKVVQVCCML